MAHTYRRQSDDDGEDPRAFRASKNQRHRTVTPTTTPQVGMPCTVRGVRCRVITILPMGTVEVMATDGTERCWRVSGLGVPR